MSASDFQDRPPRQYPYFCHTCGIREKSEQVPAGWYVVQRALGYGEKHLRLGAFCSVRCLVAAQRRLENGHSRHAEYLGLQDEFAEHASKIEQALRLMYDQGFSIREVADIVEVPTETLRRWLNAGSICTNEDDRLDAPRVPAPRQGPVPIADFVSGRNSPSPVSAINELEQAGYLSGVSWDFTHTGPAHHRVFVFSVSAVLADTSAPVAAQARRSTKSQAKTAAAQGLLDRLTEPEELTAPDPRP